MSESQNPTLHMFLDFHYDEMGGDRELRRRLEHEDANSPGGTYLETALHVAVRRYRTSAVRILLDHGVKLDELNGGRKTAYQHARRRGFDDLADLLVASGASAHLDPADEFAIAVSEHRLDDAAELLKHDPGMVRTGNPEEDRLLADVAGRNSTEPVEFLIASGADLEARGLDDGSPLQIAAWFGQPQNVRLLLDAGASIDVWDTVHQSSPIGWAVHGSRYSGGADERQAEYCSIVNMLLKAGAPLHYPDESGPAYLVRLRADASEAVKELLPEPE